ncbi:hypothetical protein RV14_GL002189 [Enterococcus ratti]|uniref:Uncharacterized protein n=1 Tax=Enterococcus ratti TaxID=150033 RepID=A0A1L8WNL1_9ENTE|nr:hypothetical protein RV14_GL002189 [Enterococcus ratti]
MLSFPKVRGKETFSVFSFLRIKRVYFTFFQGIFLNYFLLSFASLVVF